MSWVKRRRDEEDERGGVVIELDPIGIVGDPGAPEIPLEDVPLEEGFDDGRGGRVINELAPIEIQGRVPQRTEPSYDLPDFIVDAVGQPVTDTGSGLGGWEAPEWLGRAIADDEGNAPEGVLEAARNLAPDAGYLGSALLSPASLLGGLTYDAAADRPTPSREDRTLYAAPAIAGAADALSFGLADDAADLVYGDNSGSSMDWAEEQYPGSFNAGAGAALLGQAAIPGATMDDAPAYARAAATALDSGVQGALSGFGHSDAETIGGRLNDAAGDALLGGALGGGVGYAAGRLADEATRPVDGDEVARLMRDANLERVSQSGGSQSLSSKRMRTLLPGTSSEERIEAANRLVGRLRQEGVFEPRRLGPVQLPPNSDMIAQRVDELMTGASDDIGRIQGQMTDRAVDPAPLIEHARGRLQDLEVIPGAEAQANAMRRHLNQFEQRAEAGDLTFDDLQRWKTFWRQNTNFDAPLQADRQGIYRAISDTMQQGVDSMDPNAGQQYQRAREMYSIGRRFAEVNADESMQRARNRTFSLTDYLTGLEGFREGVVPGVGAVLMNRGLRRNEHGMRAMALERAAEALQQRPERFGRWAGRLQAAQQRGPRFFAAALYAAQQDDPQVRQAVMADEEAEQQQPALEPPQEAPMLPEDAPIEDFLAPIPPDDAPIEDFL